MYKLLVRAELLRLLLLAFCSVAAIALLPEMGHLTSVREHRDPAGVLVDRQALIDDLLEEM